MTLTKENAKAGAAVLGFYAAVKLCRQDGLDPGRVYQLVRDFVETGRIGEEE